MITTDIKIGKLFRRLEGEGRRVIHMGDYDLIYCGDIDILTVGARYVPLNYISRHKTVKNLILVEIESGKMRADVTVTEDHVCMIYNSDRFFENIDAKRLKCGDFVSIYSEEDGCEHVGTITDIKDRGQTTEYVYDVEVEDDMHCFYANSVLVHNSQFSNLQCVTQDFVRKYGLPKNIRDWPDEKKLELWDYCEDLVVNKVTPYVQGLIGEWCHTSNAKVLNYALEYIGDVGIYQAKKNYACHHIVEEGRKLADKTVYKGIELKKGNLDKAVKGILSPIYENTLRTEYTEDDFRKYLRDSYNKFCNMPVDDIAFWKGYNTERKASGFLQMEKVVADDGHTVGTTAVSAAGTYYNQLLEKLNIGDKYEHILLGDKIRFVYVKCRKYPIKYIAYKNRFPKEFYDIMQVDYETMFDKTVLKPLERYFLASGFKKFDPTKTYADTIDDL